MKRLQSIIMTLVLLMVAGTAAWAQNSGKLEYNGCKMTYSVSGGTIVDQGDSHAGVQRTITIEAQRGNTITFTCAGTGVNNRKCHFKMIVTTGQSEYEGILLETKKIDEQKVTYSYMIPRNARYVRMQATYDTNLSREGRSKPLSFAVNCSVVEGASTTGTDPVAKEDDDPCDCAGQSHVTGGSSSKDCNVRFKDITGDVSFRRECQDDDSWVGAEFESVLHYCERIKTEEDSEAVLGLADRTALTMLSKTILILPPYEGEISNIRMVMGIIWINMKKSMLNGGELRIHGTQAVAGIRGTIVAMEELGNETRFWLLTGKVDVTSKKTGKTVELQAGQMTITGRDGQTKIQKFDIEKAAKRFKIPMDEIRNHYSDTGSTDNTSVLFTEDKLNYKVLSANTVELTSELKGSYSGHVKIPSVVKHNGVTYQVVGIGKRAFADQTKMKSVEIPASVTSIGEDAFYNTGLASVAVPGNNANVQRHAFRSCRLLTTAIISGKNAYCHPEAFADCKYLQDLRIESPSATPATNRSTQTTTTTTTTPQGGVKVSSPGKYSFTIPTNK